MTTAMILTIVDAVVLGRTTFFAPVLGALPKLATSEGMVSSKLANSKSDRDIPGKEVPAN
jgi:hypothetical protein